MAYTYTSSPRPIPVAKPLAPPKTHTPGSRVKKRGHRYYFPGVGRWCSRDPIEEYGGVNLFEFVVNCAIGLTDGWGEIPFERNDCMRKGRKEFEQWLKEHGINIVDKDVRRLLNLGCVGLTCLDQGSNGLGPPEVQPGTECWLSEDAARKDCQRCRGLTTCCTVFAKQGAWTHGKPPRDDGTGRVNCHSVGTLTPGESDWNYVLSKNGWYFWAEAGVPRGERNDPQNHFWICKGDMPSYGTATIWAASCHAKSKGMPTP